MLGEVVARLVQNELATRSNPVFKAFCERLEARGKRFKAVMIAAARKLLEILNVMLRTKTPWNPELALPR